MLVLVAVVAVQLWGAPAALAEAGSYRLWAGETLYPGERLVSPRGAFSLVMQTDGNLVEYGSNGTPVWASGTNTPGSVLQMQSDGNAVIYAPGHVAVWETQTVGSGAHTIEVQDDRNVVLYAPGHVAVWETGQALPVSPGEAVAAPANPEAVVSTGATGPDGPHPDGHLDYIRCTIWGTVENDVLIGTPGDDLICGQGGDDRIEGRGGFDQLYGGPGDDTITGGDTVQTLNGAALVASLQGLYPDQIWGDEGDDTIVGGGGKDKLEGGPGRDTIEGGDDDDHIYGDALMENPTTDGADDIYTGSGNDGVTAGGGDDVVVDSGNTIADIVQGGTGDDVIVGTDGFSSAYNGGPGDDFLFPPTLRLSPLGNYVTGGDGNDIAVLVNGFRDSFTPGEWAQKVPLPLLQDCTLDVPIARDNYDKVSKVQLGCPILGSPVDLQISGDGKISIGSDVHSKSISLNPADWRKLTQDVQTRLQGDVCVCDQLVGVPVLQQDVVF